MRIKLDENIPARLAEVLARLGHDVETVNQEGLTGQGDSRVWRAVQSAGRFFVTQDLDFSDVRKFMPGRHHGLLLVRLKAPGRQAIVRRVFDVFRSEDVRTWAGCFVVLTDSKVRIIHPRRSAK